MITYTDFTNGTAIVPFRLDWTPVMSTVVLVGAAMAPLAGLFRSPLQRGQTGRYTRFPEVEQELYQARPATRAGLSARPGVKQSMRRPHARGSGMR